MMKTDFAVYKTDRNARYTMAYLCACCGKPAIATGDDMKGMFFGECGRGTKSTVLAS
jgi:hypothetical protein